MGYVKLISVSQESTWHGCPWRYKLERIDRLPWEASVEMAYGTASHKALETMHRARRSGMSFAMSDLMQWWRKDFAPHKSRLWEFRARQHLEIYASQVLPLVDPLFIEEKFYMDVAPGFKLVGIVDCYTWDGVIIDAKFTSKVRSRKGSLQEPAYWLGLNEVARQLTAPRPREYWRLNFITQPDADGRYRIARERCVIEQKHIDGYRKRMVAFTQGLQAQVYRKNPKFRYCHPRFCPHYDNPCDHGDGDAEPASLDAKEVK